MLPSVEHFYSVVGEVTVTPLSHYEARYLSRLAANKGMLHLTKRNSTVTNPSHIKLGSGFQVTRYIPCCIDVPLLLS